MSTNPQHTAHRRRGYWIRLDESVAAGRSSAELGYACRAAARRAEADPTIEPGSTVLVTEADFASERAS